VFGTSDKLVCEYLSHMFGYLAVDLLRRLGHVLRSLRLLFRIPRSLVHEGIVAGTAAA
jgi:hypothetical protein